MAHRFREVKIQRVKTVYIEPNEDCCELRVAKQPRVLSAALALARALPCEADELIITGWCSTPKVSKAACTDMIRFLTR